MACEVFAAASFDERSTSRQQLYVEFQSDGYYWYLYPYFESAKLPSKHELIDLYGDNEISGYELDRLENRLQDAKMDMQWRAESWLVTIGWSGSTISRKTAEQRMDHKETMLALIDRVLDVIAYAKSNELKLCVVGD
ncbi:MAG: hypothetical protein WD738_04045 [Pirellulales bacterium]